ncbi:MAG: DUF1249 domain-containing protein [Halorhodospira halophila]|uniref:DUF1249 domain-containing protein n=2 Tax=Ectothiorhodospiraceae TaxID=72276 RepID=UPI001911E5F2|nr:MULTISPECIES: DUF1249 domain-containing protein [Halorhodospira]MBK5937253.1 hypothetical protein [Halorhodospira halophila]MBK5942551.1 hypothetical protein [Halorhodospira halophila]MCC3751499.1 DUF1249 domain-containing protein [Halorhodospira halophila]MCG5528977.1 DUF1249 domain-containing protein [Halorhodospira halophila]MCG5533031.1 DUF1249 domain-containing protein [Halorhodospira sp. 9621]
MLARMVQEASATHRALEAKPRTFAALMELYETNYIYMRRLVPDLERADAEREISFSRDGVALRLEVLERSRYTTTVLLTHRFASGCGAESLPELTVRVYHDARVAEVMATGGRTVRDPAGSLEQRWVSNRFLSRWLRFSLGEGHGFRLQSGSSTDRP